RVVTRDLAWARGARIIVGLVKREILATKRAQVAVNGRLAAGHREALGIGIERENLRRKSVAKARGVVVGHVAVTGPRVARRKVSAHATRLEVWQEYPPNRRWRIGL